MSTQEIGALIDSVNEMTQTVANKTQEIDQKVTEAEKKTDAFIAQARSEYIRFTHYVPLPTKLVIPALGLSDQEIDAYQYETSEDYYPKTPENVNCFGDIVEFANGFNQLPIPSGMNVYLHLLVNVAGDNNILQATNVHFLRYEMGSTGFHQHLKPQFPFLFKDNDNAPKFTIMGRDWGDNYKDRNILSIGNFNNFNGQSYTTLRIINLGAKQLEIFGIGVEVRA